MNIKPIPGFPGYFASECGKILSTRGGTIMHELKPRLSHHGYLNVSIILPTAKTGKRQVHRLVGFAWCEGFRDGLVINHKDMVKTNNHASNLEWVTHKQNIRHAIKNGERKKAYAGKYPRLVAGVGDAGKEIFYPSICEASRAIGIPAKRGAPMIHGALNGKHRTAYGRTWRYVMEF